MFDKIVRLIVMVLIALLILFLYRTYPEHPAIFLIMDRVMFGTLITFAIWWAIVELVVALIKWFLRRNGKGKEQIVN